MLEVIEKMMILEVQKEDLINFPLIIAHLKKEQMEELVQETVELMDLVEVEMKKAKIKLPE